MKIGTAAAGTSIILVTFYYVHWDGGLSRHFFTFGNLIKKSF